MATSTMQSFSRLTVRSHRFLKESLLSRQKFGSPNGYLHWTSRTSQFLIKRNYATQEEVSSNPFFEKYKEKIKHLQSTNPEEYDEKMKELARRLNPQASKEDLKADDEGLKETSSKPVNIARPSEKARAGVGMTQAKSLDSIMKMELLENKTAEEITQIWNQYHSDKDCIFTVLKNHEFLNLLEKSKQCPVFVFPVRRKDGVEMILTQFDRHDIYFTPLAMFQLVKEESPPCLTLNHYTELMDDKGIVLMKGQYDDKLLSSAQALSLVQLVSIFYGKESKFYPMVHKFNHKPETFDYNELIEAYKSLPQYDME